MRIMNFELDIIPPTFPSANHFGCKDTNLFWIEQIFLSKVYGLKLKGKDLPEFDLGIMDKDASARMRTKCTTIARRNNAVV